MITLVNTLRIQQTQLTPNATCLGMPHRGQGLVLGCALETFTTLLYEHTWCHCKIVGPNHMPLRGHGMQPVLESLLSRSIVCDAGHTTSPI